MQRLELPCALLGVQKPLKPASTEMSHIANLPGHARCITGDAIMSGRANNIIVVSVAFLKSSLQKLFDWQCFVVLR